jgi:hypothetical protein
MATASKKAPARKAVSTVARKVSQKTAAPVAKKVVAPRSPVASGDAGKARKPAKAPKPDKVEKTKVKLVRDSFTMPAEDWALIARLKERALGFKRPSKKSELLRAGLQVLAALPEAQLQQALDRLTPLKPGRPKAEAKADKK